MTHSNAALGKPDAAESAARRRFRLTALALAAGAVLSALTIWITTPFSASATSRPPASAGSRQVTIDVIAKTTSFRVLPNDGFISTLNLVDKKTGKQVGSSVFYCLEVQPVISAGSQPPAGTQTLVECPGTATFTGKGTISILGSFLAPPKPGQVWYQAVVGGTGRYRHVRGELKITQINPRESEGIWKLRL
jgi:hypothetical protein